MATKSKNFFIESLNNGYVLRTDGKSRVIESKRSIDIILEAAMNDLTGQLNNVNVRNMSITIVVEENCPQQAK